MQTAAPDDGNDVGSIADVGRGDAGKSRSTRGVGRTAAAERRVAGLAAGQGDMPTEIWEKVKNHPCYSEEAHHHYARMHVAVAPACNIQCNYCNRKYDCANEFAPRRGQREADAGAGGQEGAGGGLHHSADDGARHRRSGRPACQSGEDLQDLRADLQDSARTSSCACRPTGSRCRTTSTRLPGSTSITSPSPSTWSIPRSARRSIPWVFYKHKRYTGVEAAKILTERQMLGPGDADRARHPLQGQFGDDPRHQRQASGRGEQGGQVARRVPAQHHAADLGAGARHRVRPHRPARPHARRSSRRCRMPAKAR